MTLDATHWSRVTEAFGRMAELPTADRSTQLAQLHRQDPAVHDEVASLLAANDLVGDRFERPLFAGVPDAASAPPMIGRRIGPYQVIREIGHGGMGAVWEARRADDQYQKRVAIKMVALGQDTEAMLRRFRHERDLLAQLEHRNIATLVDGGMTEEGQPWFAMEFIEGETIIAWCDARRLTVRQRVQLFRQVCAATQYAHEHLVIHRDLKPGNILVANDGTVKLLDFGIAKLTDPTANHATVTELTPLTAAYASPEQWRGEIVSTASDIFSLGVVLYELLSGVRPFGGAGGTSADRTATAPSRMITPETAATRGDDGALRVTQSVKGDLDAVVLMALRPEVERRYRSVQQFVDDLQRTLDGRPVSARPDTLAYRTSAFVRRNRLVAIAGLAAVFALVFATIFSWRQAVVARADRDRAVLEAARTKQVTQFFQDVLSSPKPNQEGKDVTVVEALDAVIPRIDSTFSASPDLRAAIKNTLGSTLHDMGLYDRARPLIEDALRLRDSLDRGQISRERADALYNLAGVENETGASARAESLYVASLAMYAALTPGDSSDVYHGMNNLATAVHSQGRLAEAAVLYGRVASWLKRRDPPEVLPATVALVNQATALAELGQYREAESLLRESAASYEKLLGPESTRLGTVLQPLAGALLFQEKFSEAESAARRAWSINTKALGSTNVATVQALRMLVNVLMDAGRCAEAVPLADSILAMRHTVLPDTDLSIATALLYGGWCRARLGQLEMGETQVREGLRLRQATFPATHWAVAQAESFLGDVVAQRGPDRRIEAERLLRAGYEGMRRELDSNHVRVKQARQRLERLTEPKK